MTGELLSETPVLAANSGSIGDQPQNADVSQHQVREKQFATDGYPATLHPFPTSFSSDPSESLSPLRDSHSSYKAVSKTCLLLNQFASNGSSKATSQDEGSHFSTCGSMEYVDSSPLFHDSSFAQILSDSFAALLECIREHHDRRCRVMACKTVALVARASYARLRKSPHTLTGMRDDTSGASTNNSSSAGNNYLNRLNDEVGSDVPMALCIAALEDMDDGVAATAMSSLGTMVLSTMPTPGSLSEDELWTEVRAIAQIGQQPYAPSIRQLLDDDATTQQSELQVRILENAICPRLLQLVSRFLVLNHSSQVEMVLPVLTTSLVYLSKTTVPDTGRNESNSTTRRVVGEHTDYNALIEMVVDGILLPWMQNSTLSTMGATLAAALSSVRLIHACPLAPWVTEVSHWAIEVLKDECLHQAMCLETKLPILATLVILSRIVPLPERSDLVLGFVVDRVLELPSTVVTPSGVTTAGLLLNLNNGKTGSSPHMDQYRKPTRPAFWTEIALSFFMDGPLKINNARGADVRSKALLNFLESPKLQDILEDKGEHDPSIGTHGTVREEVITAFCMVAFRVGRRHKTPSKKPRGSMALTARPDELEEWVKLSFALLEAFSPCIGWVEAPPYMDEGVTMLVASQAAYTGLLQEVLHASGLLSASSISLKMTPFSNPSHLLWDQLAEASEYLVQFDPMPLMGSIVDSIGKLMDDIVKKEIKGAGITSHQMRIFLMSLAVDQWVQARHQSSKRHTTPEIGMNIESAKQLLVTISPRRMIGKVVESNKSQIENYSKSKKEKYKKFAQETVSVCVACIETMALMACLYTKRFGSNSDTKAVLNYSVKALQGKSGNDSDAPILPVCQAAIERIQLAFQSSDKMVSDSISLSPLVPDEFKRRSKISTSRVTQGRDAFNEGYITQLSRQIISSRADRCIFAFPPIHNLPSTVYKQNWLRLALPPLPQSRNPQVSISNIPKFTWGSNVSVCSAGSDPAAVTLAYFLRRNMRYDGEDEFRLMVTMRVDNLTAVEVPNGLRLEMGITEENVSASEDSQDVVSLEISKSLTEGYENAVRENMFGSSAVTYKRGLKAGDYITWHIMMDPLPMNGSLTFNPSVVFRAVEKETINATWVTSEAPKKEGEETSLTSASSKAGSEKSEDDQGKEQKQYIAIQCEPMKLSPIIGLQPCSFVFFRDRLGDIESFRFLWSRMPCQLAPLKLVDDPEFTETRSTSFDDLRVAAISTLKFEPDPVPGGMIINLWAFMSPRGKRAMYVLFEQESDGNKVLYVRGDDKQLLLCLVGTSAARKTMISALKPGLIPEYQEIFS